MDIFKIIFDEHLVQHIVDETNKFFHYVMKNLITKQHSKLNKWQETNVNEMYTFFALTFLMAHQKKITKRIIGLHHHCYVLLYLVK
jgi:hypothetical protein